MSDEDALLAAKLAMAAGLVHPMDWLKVYKSHTPHEWALQKALMEVDPWGAVRDDSRAAFNTAQTIVQLSLGGWDESKIGKMLESLMFFTRASRPAPVIVGAGALRQAMGEE